MQGRLPVHAWSGCCNSDVESLPPARIVVGFPSGISGAELAERAVVQAVTFGARISLPAEATALEQHDGYYAVTLDDGSRIAGRAVLIATGARYRKLAVARLEEFEGKSIYYAATQVEALLCHGIPVAVVGGGNSAGQATVFLALHAARVRLVIRESDIGKCMSRYLADQIERSADVEVLRHTEVRELVRDRALEALVVEDNRTGERHTLDARTLFVFISAEPNARWLGDHLALDDRGFILTGQDAARSAPASTRRGAARQPPLPLETSWPGVFAAGDVRSDREWSPRAAIWPGSARQSKGALAYSMHGGWDRDAV